MSTKYHGLTRRSAIKASAGIVTGSLLAGCTGDQNSGGNDSGGGESSKVGQNTTRSGGKTITIVTQQGSPRGKAAFNEIKKSFEDETPHTVEMVYTPEVLEEVPRRIRSGDAPEIITANTSEAVDWLNKGVLAPMTEIVGEVEDQFTNNEYALEKGGEHYALSWAVNPSSLHTWRNDWLDEAGLGIDVGADGAATRSWDDLREMASTLDARGERVNGLITTVALTKKGTVDSTNYLASNGAEWYGVENGEPVVTIDKGKNLTRAVEALEFMQELYEYSPNSIGWDWRDDFNEFLKGSTGGVLYAYGRILEGAKANNPTLEDVIAPLAQPNSDRVDAKHPSTRASGASIIQMGGPEVDTNVDAAADYIRHMINRPELFKEFALATPFWKIPLMKDLQDAYVKDPVIAEKPDMAKQMFQVIEQTTTNTVLEGGTTNPAAGPIYSNGTHGMALHEMIVNDTDPEQAVRDMADEIRTYL